MYFHFYTFLKSKEKIETMVTNHCMLSVILGLRNPFPGQNSAFKLCFQSCRKELQLSFLWHSGTSLAYP